MTERLKLIEELTELIKLVRKLSPEKQESFLIMLQAAKVISEVT